MTTDLTTALADLAELRDRLRRDVPKCKCERDGSDLARYADAVDAAIRLLEEKTRDIANLRLALTASLAANVAYEVLETAYSDLLQAGQNWVSGVDVYGPCGGCGECSQCALATLLDEKTKE